MILRVADVSCPDTGGAAITPFLIDVFKCIKQSPGHIRWSVLTVSDGVLKRRGVTLFPRSPKRGGMIRSTRMCREEGSLRHHRTVVPWLRHRCEGNVCPFASLFVPPSRPYLIGDSLQVKRFRTSFLSRPTSRSWRIVFSGGGLVMPRLSAKRMSPLRLKVSPRNGERRL